MKLNARQEAYNALAKAAKKLSSEVGLGAFESFFGGTTVPSADILTENNMQAVADRLKRAQADLKTLRKAYKHFMAGRYLDCIALLIDYGSDGDSA